MILFISCLFFYYFTNFCYQNGKYAKQGWCLIIQLILMWTPFLVFDFWDWHCFIFIYSLSILELKHKSFHCCRRRLQTDLHLQCNVKLSGVNYNTLWVLIFQFIKIGLTLHSEQFRQKVENLKRFDYRWTKAVAVVLHC